MGIIFGRRKDKEAEKQAEEAQERSELMLGKIKAVADRDRAEYEALQKKQIEEARALDKRSKTMQGGGRKGLMSTTGYQGVA